MDVFRGAATAILLIITGTIVTQFENSIPFGMGGVIPAIMVISSLIDATKTSTVGAMVVAFVAMLFAAAIGDSADVGLCIVALLVGLVSFSNRNSSVL
jgi:hypothetical protein